MLKTIIDFEVLKQCGYSFAWTKTKSGFGLISCIVIMVPDVNINVAGQIM